MAGINKDLFVGELLERFVERNDPIRRARNISGLVATNETIHFADLPTVPTFFVDPNYPIADSPIAANDVPIGLHEVATGVSYINDNEKRASSIDLPTMHVDAHEESLSTGTKRWSYWNIAPKDDAITTLPFIKTDGSDNGVNSMKRCSRANLRALRKAWNDQNIPEENRILILCSQHESDLMAEDTEFEKRVLAATPGQPFTYMGFEIWVSGNLFKYDAAFEKPITYDGVGTRDTSIAFQTSCVGWAMGTTTMYEDKPEPKYHRTALNFGSYWTAVRLRSSTSTDIGVGIIVSDDI